MKPYNSTVHGKVTVTTTATTSKKNVYPNLRLSLPKLWLQGDKIELKNFSPTSSFTKERASSSTEKS